MATIAQITSDPRWGQASPDQRKRILAKASDAPKSLVDMVSSYADYVKPLPMKMADFAMKALEDPQKTYRDYQEFIPATAGIVGTALGGPPVGVLAAQGADVLRRGANVALGVPTPLDPLKIALGNIGQAVMAAPEKFIPKAVAAPAAKYGGMAAKAIGRGVSSGLQTSTGIAKSRFPQMFENPELPIPIVSTIRRWMAGKGVESAIKKAGFASEQTAKEVFDPLLTQARKTATRAVDIVEKPIKGEGFTMIPMTAKELGTEMVKGRRAIQRVIKATPWKDMGSIPAMMEKLHSVDRVLSQLDPKVKKSMSKYAQAAMANEFSNIFPLVMSGNISYVKSLVPMFAALGGGAVTPAGALIGTVSSPILMGAATGLAGVINKALKVPQFRNVILSQASEKVTGE